MSQLTNSNTGSGPTPPVGVGCFILGSGPLNLIDTDLQYIPVFSQTNPIGPEANAQFVVPVDMTIDRMYVDITENVMTNSNVIYFRVNGVNTALQLTVPNGGYTGLVSNLVDSVSVSAGDLIDWTSDQDPDGPAFGSISVRACTASGDTPALEFETDDGTVTPNGSGVVFVDGTDGIFTEGTSDPNTITISIPSGIVSGLYRQNDNLNQDLVDSYLTFFTVDIYSDESSATMVMPYAGVISHLYFDIVDSTSTGPTTFTVRKNSVDTSLVVTIPAATSGITSNLVNTVTVVAGDRISIKSSAAAGSVLYGTISAKFVAT